MAERAATLRLAHVAKVAGIGVALAVGLGACTTTPGETQTFATNELPAGASVQFRHDTGTSSMSYGKHFSAKASGGVQKISFGEAYAPNESSLGYQTLADGDLLTIVDADGNLISTVDVWVPEGYLYTNVMFAPNGSTVAIRRWLATPIGEVTAHTTIYDGLTGEQLGATVDNISPNWSPGWPFAFSQDSQQVAFAAGDDVKVMPLIPGGVPSVVATVESDSCTFLSGWTAEERLVFLCPELNPDNGSDQLWTMPATGGQPRVLDKGVSRPNTAAWFDTRNRLAMVVPGTNQIVFTRAGVAATTFPPFSVGGQVLAIIEDVPGATARPLTQVRPTTIEGEVFTSSDVPISVTGA